MEDDTATARPQTSLDPAPGRPAPLPGTGAAAASVAGPGGRRGERRARRRDWRWLFRWHLRLTAFLLAGLFGAVGIMLAALGLRLGASDDRKQILLEVGVSLALFGVTTLFLTFIVANSLDQRLELTIEEQLERQTATITQHNDTVRQLTDETRKAVEDSAERLRPLGGNWRDLGLTNVYLTRSDALEGEFGERLRDELLRAQDTKPPDENDEEFRYETFKYEADGVHGTGANDHALMAHDRKLYNPESNRCRLWIAASCMKGLLESASQDFDGLGVFTWAAELAAANLLDLRILLTHPEYARVRANQENREEEAIKKEIDEALGTLQHRKVPAIRVRMLATSPTVFAIATRDHMLLNPYPYSQEAYRSFTLTVRRSHVEPGHHRAINRDIFEQYARRHFIQPWISRNTLIVPGSYGIPPLPEGTHPPQPSGSREDFDAPRP